MLTFVFATWRLPRKFVRLQADMTVGIALYFA